uniref:At1g12830/F13K23_6 n=1 Tax=Arabidopsis thaliana TaxID=3702 RepID=Q94A53_ARATH|nr:At1g12830/F13K23_6 [Arabidopsis thaliana]AAM51575.1 At1g12830/F13K23_6 [Arabidopsis thaliana]
MADVENQQDSSFPVKRKSDLFCQDQDNVTNKAQKLNPSLNSADSESKDGETNGSGQIENLNSSTEETIGAESSVLSEKAAEEVESGVIGDVGAEEEQEDEEDEEEDDEEEEEEEEVVDRKGKGISREDKGKGKMIEVEESDDEDDSDDDEDDEGFDEDEKRFLR